jgi:hypothetical protein
MMSAPGLKYEKNDVYLDNCMLFWKEHANEKKCLECGQSRFVEVVTQDGGDRSCTNAASLLFYHTLLKVVVYL